MAARTPLDDAFAALMRELGKLGGLDPTATQRRRREALVGDSIASAAADPALERWGRFLKSVAAELALGGDAALLQKALAHADEHPVTQSAERWLAEVGFDKPYFRLLNRPPGMGPRLPRAILAKHCKGAVAVGPDGRTVAVADENRVAIYDAVEGTLRKTFKTRHPECVSRLAIHPDGRRLFTGRGLNDADVRIYDIETGKLVRTLPGRGDSQDFALSADGRYVLGRDESLRLWAVEGTGRKPVWGPREEMGSDPPALHPNGKECVFRWGDEISIFSLEDGSLARKVSLTMADPKLLDSPDGEALVLSDGKHFLCVIGNAPVAEVFDLETGALVKTLEGHSKPINALALSPDGKRFATAAGDGFVRIWESHSLECVWAEHAHPGTALGVAFLANDTVVSTGDDGIGRVWDIDEGAPWVRAMHPTDNVLIMEAMPDGKHVLALHDDGTLLEWEIATGTCARRFDASKIPNDGRLRLWVSPDGRFALLTRDRGHGSIRPPRRACVFRFDLVTGESGLFYTCQDDTLAGPAAVIDGGLYVAPDAGGLIRVALSPSGDIEPATAEEVSSELLSPYEIVANRWLLGYANTNVLSVVDTKQPSERKNIARTDWPFTFGTRSQHTDGDRTLVAVASSDTKAIVMTLPSGEILHRLGSLPPPPSEIWPSGVAFSLDGRTVYTGSPSRELFAWDMETGASHSWPLPDTSIHGIYCHTSLGNGLVVQSSSSMMAFDTTGGKVLARWGYSLGHNLYRRMTVIDQGVFAMWIDQQLRFLTIRP